MAFNPNLPAARSRASAAEMRAQLNGLKELIDAVPAGPPGPVGPPGPGFNLRGEYAVGVTYQPLDVVTWNGNIYLANTTTSQPPDVYPDWVVLSIAGPVGPQGPPGEVTTAQLNEAVQTLTAQITALQTALAQKASVDDVLSLVRSYAPRNVDTVLQLPPPWSSNPPERDEFNEVRDKVNELVSGLVHPV